MLIEVIIVSFFPGTIITFGSFWFLTWTVGDYTEMHRDYTEIHRGYTEIHRDNTEITQRYTEITRRYTEFYFFCETLRIFVSLQQTIGQPVRAKLVPFGS